MMKAWMTLRALVVCGGVLAAHGPVLAGGDPQPLVPTTLNDFFLPGTQPLDVGNIDYSGYNEDFTTCSSCHYHGTDAAKPYLRWTTSMMGQASRDPIFYACLDIANADAGQSGDLCIRCHVPRAWLLGRSTPTDGSSFEPPSDSDFLPGDLDGVSCDVCHRMVDPINADATLNTPDDASDQSILLDLGENHGVDAVPTETSLQNGSYVIDPDENKRGPYVLAADHAANNHDWGQSPYHRRAILCANCHDVSNPVYSRQADGTYALNALDAPHPTLGKYDMFPIERTFSEWSRSEFAHRPVDMGGRFDPANPEVSTCQDCHMPRIAGKACTTDQATQRPDIGVHNFAGSTRWVLNAIYQSTELDNQGMETGRTGMTAASLTQADTNVQQMMDWAADLQLKQIGNQIRVRVVNNSGHKLTTGYPEGRRMWLNVKFYDLQIKDNTLIGEHGHYDASTADLEHDTKIYETELGVDQTIANATGINGGRAGHTFHFVLNNVYLKDNRIPPRGFSHAAFEAVQAAPIEKENETYPSTYADGQFWDDTLYPIPGGQQPSEYVEVTLYHQTTTKEYIEFLRDNNPNAPQAGDRGEAAYDAWVAQGKSPPTQLAFATLKLDPGPTGGTIRYVDDTATGNNDGTSWTDAFVDLQSALAVVSPGDQIWVAVGTYKPTATMNRAISFAIPEGVSVYGGFDGNEASLATRAGRYDETILSGDIGVPDAVSDNSHHVVTVAAAGMPDETILDGFMIIGGNADETSNGRGAGLSASATGFLVVTNCLFIGNQANVSGAGMSNTSAGVVTLTDCMFSGNVRLFDAIMVGGGFYNGAGAYARLLNCSFAGNEALLGGGVYSADGSTVVVSNCILWGNLGLGGPNDEDAQISTAFAAALVSHTIVQGLTGALGGVGNLGDDPRFLDADGADNAAGTPDDNLRLGHCSPAIDAGHNNAVPGLQTDLDHLSRHLDDPLIPDTGGGAAPIIDLGPYEYSPAAVCRGDIEINNSVDVIDLLRVLADWGPCPGPCRPECVADTNCDCVVDVADLINVLNTWGPCQ